MEIIIFFIISSVFIALYFIVGVKPFLFKDVYINDLYKYIFVLLYRGDLIYYNSKNRDGLLLILFSGNFGMIFFEKYRIESKIGLFLGFPIYDDNISKDKILLNILNELYPTLKYFYDEKPRDIYQKNIKNVLYIDIKQDVNLGQELVKIISQDILKLHNNTYDIYFENINPIPDKIIGFDKTPDFIKMGVDITLPTIKMIMRVRQRKIFFHELKKWFKG